MHSVHFSITPRTALNCGASYGHTQLQYRQPMHASPAVTTAPVRGSRVMARAGQYRRHGASRQWLQAIDK